MTSVLATAFRLIYAKDTDSCIRSFTHSRFAHFQTDSCSISLCTPIQAKLTWASTITLLTEVISTTVKVKKSMCSLWQYCLALVQFKILLGMWGMNSIFAPRQRAAVRRTDSVSSGLLFFPMSASVFTSYRSQVTSRSGQWRVKGSHSAFILTA